MTLFGAKITTTNNHASTRYELVHITRPSTVRSDHCYQVTGNEMSVIQDLHMAQIKQM